MVTMIMALTMEATTFVIRCKWIYGWERYLESRRASIPRGISVSMDVVSKEVPVTMSYREKIGPF